MRHRHNYFRISVLLLLVGLFYSLFVTAKPNAQAVTQNGSQNITAIVPGPPPTTPAIITSPPGNITVGVTPLVVSGSCDPGLLVRLFDNNLLVGTTTCALDGTFSMNITLITGTNTLTALNYDTLDQAGPASASVIVTVLEPTHASAPSNTRVQRPPSGPANSDGNQPANPSIPPNSDHKPSGGVTGFFVSTFSSVVARWYFFVIFVLLIALLIELFLIWRRRHSDKKTDVPAQQDPPNKQ